MTGRYHTLLLVGARLTRCNQASGVMVMPLACTTSRSHKSCISPSALRFQSNSTKTSSASQESPPKRSKRISRRGILVTFILGGILFSLSGSSSSSSHPTALNTTTFAPYTITSRTQMSPSSFVLTLIPHHPNPDPPYLLPGTNRWRHPLWSVEFKQPEVQIARHYTPLPPTINDTKDDEHASAGALRFYIRTIGDGEMSRYLNRLREGQEVYLRGPHLGLDLVKRLGARKTIVFLAGGTGVVPGMQAARIALDGYEDTKVSLLWAVRTRHEIQRSDNDVGRAETSSNSSPAAAQQRRPWWDFSRGPRDPAELDPERLEGASPVASELAEMKRLYGERLSVQVVVDEEGTSFQPQHIQKTLQDAALAGEKSKTLGVERPVMPPSNPGDGCSLHDQKLHEGAGEFEPVTPGCSCAPVEGTLPGKNIFIVSGPEGFVAHYAGPKGMYGSAQGPVGGVVGQVQAQNPQLARDWLVLKL